MARPGNQAQRQGRQVGWAQYNLQAEGLTPVKEGSHLNPAGGKVLLGFRQVVFAEPRDILDLGNRERQRLPPLPQSKPRILV